jgi:peptide/nickel transport system ATP-binding protein
METSGIPADTLAQQRLLDVRKLKKFYPIKKGFLKKTVGYVKAVDEVDFFIDEGETLGLVGESGCGKTTTARCILRAVDPSGGQILFRNGADEIVDIATLSNAEMQPLRRDMQMIFQDPFASLNPRMNLLDLVAEPMLVNGIGNRRERAERVAELLQLVGLRPEHMRR